MDARLTCSDSLLHVMQSQRQTVSLSQKTDAGRQMMLHTSYLVSRPTGLSHIRNVAFYCFIQSYTDIHRHPLVDPRTIALVTLFSCKR